jgi:hypothetical protein
MGGLIISLFFHQNGWATVSQESPKLTTVGGLHVRLCHFPPKNGNHGAVRSASVLHTLAAFCRACGASGRSQISATKPQRRAFEITTPQQVAGLDQVLVAYGATFEVHLASLKTGLFGASCGKVNYFGV